MNYLDIVIAVPLLYGIVKGFEHGLIKEITGLLGLFFGAYVAINFSSYLYPKFNEILFINVQFIPIISFAILFIASIIFVKIIGYIIDKISKALALGFVSRLLGSVFGFFKILVILSFSLILAIEYNFISKENQEKSTLTIPLLRASKIIVPQIIKHKSNLLEKANESSEKAKENIESRINFQ